MAIDNSSAVSQSAHLYYAREMRDRSVAAAKAYDLNKVQEDRNPGAASDIGDYTTRQKRILDITV